MKREMLVFGIILLFIGLAISPSIYADRDTIYQEDDLVQLNVEFCGLGRKHTVKLSQEEYNEIELIFDDIKERLSNVASYDEAFIIFNDAVVALDKYGLLGGLSVKLAQRLVTGNIIEKNIKGLDEFDNAFCLVAGEADDFFRLSPLALAIIGIGFLHFGLVDIIIETLSALFPNLMEIILSEPHSDIWYNIRYGFFSIYVLLFFASIYIPINVFNWIYYGGIGSYYYSPYLTPTDGWLTTFGLNGKKEINGSFIAQTFGFTGLKLVMEDRDLFHMGCALFVQEI